MAVSGINFIVQLSQYRELLTLTGTGTYKLNVLGQVTIAIADTATAATIQTNLEALSNVTAGDVTVTGAVGGPYTIEWKVNFLGQGNFLRAEQHTGGLTTAITALAPTTNVTVAGQRNATLNRTTEEADATAKDTAPGWFENVPTFRRWTIEFDGLALESDLAQLALNKAYEDNTQVAVIVQTPAANTYHGVGTLAEWTMEGAHDDVLSATGSITGTGALTKT